MFGVLGGVCADVCVWMCVCVWVWACVDVWMCVCVCVWGGGGGGGGGGDDWEKQRRKRKGKVIIMFVVVRLIITHLYAFRLMQLIQRLAVGMYCLAVCVCACECELCMGVYDLETRLKWFRRRLDLPGMYSEWPT